MESLQGDLIRERFGLAGLPSVFSRINLVLCLAELGEFTEGIAYGEEAVRVAEAADHPYSLVFAYFGVGTLSLLKGEPQQAISVLERGLGVCRALNLPLMFPPVSSSLGSAYALSGRFGEAIPLLEQAVEQAALMKRMDRHSILMAWLGEAYLLAGRIDDAIQTSQRALTLSRDYKERGHEAWTLRILGEIVSHYTPPDADQAEAYYRQAMVLADELGMRPLLAHCHFGLGKLYRRTENRADAQQHLALAAALFRQMDMRFWLEKVERV